jgi:hypothetical protein
MDYYVYFVMYFNFVDKIVCGFGWELLDDHVRNEKSTPLETPQKSVSTLAMTLPLSTLYLSYNNVPEYSYVVFSLAGLAATYKR